MAIIPAISSGRIRDLVIRTAVLVCLLAAWELAVRNAPKTLIPAPSACLMALVQLAQEQILLPSLFDSLRRVFVGFGIAVCLGLLAGFAMGLLGPLKSACMAVFELLRPVPPIAWIPMAVALLGIGDPSAWFVIFVGAFYPVLTNTPPGCDQRREDSRRSS